MQLAHELGLWSQPGVTVANPVPATDADLKLVHDAAYIAARPRHLRVLREGAA